MKTSINLKNMRILLSMLFVFLSVNAVAQNITGTVKDNLGEPAIGASVVEKGTSNGTITDVDGKFTLKVSGKYPIEVSYIGYMTQVIHRVCYSRNSSQPCKRNHQTERGHTNTG